jgi:hypothetical protein
MLLARCTLRLSQRRATTLVVVLGLVLAAGCWDEIRYESANSEGQPTTGEPPPARGDVSNPVPPQASPVSVATAEEKTNGPADSQVDFLSYLEDLATDESSRPNAVPLSALPVPRQREAWQLGSHWSLALAIYAKGYSRDRYADSQRRAVEAARTLGIRLPSLPRGVPPKDRLRAGREQLVSETGPLLADELAERFDADHRALFELATKTNLLLLVYRPDDAAPEPLVAAIEEAAVACPLPPELWQPLVDLLKQRADFAEVRQALFRLHDQAPAYLP